MGKFEETFFYPLINKKSLLYLRYIVDIFLIWTGTKEELDKLMNHLNKIHPSIKFDYENSNKEINFLDTFVYKRGKKFYKLDYIEKNRIARTIYTINLNTLNP